ncbi:kelch domain-containing protein 1 isoform X1 [Alligator mississippiensis]|uniref:kelch domain-containing protein 1 isoform X1 n=1 Tax=Alligator mississippiensis TaxID=8496 RepID=UPI002877FE7E|nr:kelch domain-containing protein 1 isoform X1 [Alligator mississippiensis]
MSHPDLSRSIEENEVYLPNDELWVYEIDTALWTMHLMEGELPTSMSGSCGACINGSLYIFGGFDDKGYSNRLYYVNLRTKNGTYRWKKITNFKGQPPTPRDKLSCWVYKDRLIYFGGYGCRKHNELSDCFDVHDAFWEGQIYWGWHNDVHVFDTNTQTWFQPTIRGGEPPQPRAAHTCAVLGNKGYIFGGRVLQSRMNDLHCLNLDTWTWSGSCLSLCKTMEYNCFDDKSVWIPLKMIYTQNQNEHISYSKNQPWTAKTHVSVHTTPLTIFMAPTSIYNASIHTNGEKPKDRSWHTLTSVGDDKLFLFGGLSSDNVPLSDGWIHSTTTNGWRQLTHLPKSRPRLWHTACLGKEGEVMVFGGSKDDLHFMDTGHCSDLLIFQTEPYSLLRCEKRLLPTVEETNQNILGASSVRNPFALFLLLHLCHCQHLQLRECEDKTRDMQQHIQCTSRTVAGGHLSQSEVREV